MKNKLLMLIILLFPVIISAIVINNYSVSTNNINEYVESLTEYKLYLVQGNNTPYRYERGVLSSDNNFKKGGLLNILEFNTSKDSEGATYLFDGLSYWTMTSDNSNQYVISPSTINRYESKSKSETSGLRVSEYVKSNVSVTGVGTYSNPWKFVRPGYDVALNLTNATINGQSTFTETITSNNISYTVVPESGHAMSSISCTNGNVEYNSYTLTINNITTNTECELEYIDPGRTFSYVESNQTYNVLSSGYYEVDAYGAQGGNSGGLGGEIKGRVYLNVGDTLQINTGGINGYNGGGTSTGITSYVGGGSSTIKLNSNYIVIAAGGGATGANGTTGGAGGNGTGSGGVSAGAGVGNAGTNGGGGSSSPNYVTSYCARCTVSETNCTSSTSSSSFCTYGCSASLSPGCSSSGTFTYYSSCSCGATQCGNSSTYCYATQVTKTCSCSTSNVSTTSCSGSYISCDSWGYNTTQGKPGSGGSNSTDASITNVTSSSGLRTGNGQITIIYNG